MIALDEDSTRPLDDRHFHAIVAQFHELFPRGRIYVQVEPHGPREVVGTHFLKGHEQNLHFSATPRLVGFTLQVVRGSSHTIETYEAKDLSDACGWVKWSIQEHSEGLHAPADITTPHDAQPCKELVDLCRDMNRMATQVGPFSNLWFHGCDIRWADFLSESDIEQGLSDVLQEVDACTPLLPAPQAYNTELIRRLREYTRQVLEWGQVLTVRLYRPLDPQHDLIIVESPLEGGERVWGLEHELSSKAREFRWSSSPGGLFKKAITDAVYANTSR